MLIKPTSGVAQKQLTTSDIQQHSSIARKPRTLEEQKRRLGPVDLLEVQLVGQADSAQRYRMMYTMRNVVVNTWNSMLRAKYPEMSDMERSRLLFERLQGD